MKQCVVALILWVSLGTLFCADNSLPREHCFAIAQKRDRAVCSIQVAWLRHQINSWKARYADQQLDLQAKADFVQTKLHIDIGALQEEVAGLNDLLAANADRYDGLQEKLRLQIIQARDHDEAQVAQIAQKEAQYQGALAQITFLLRQKSELQLSCDRLRGQYEVLEYRNRQATTQVEQVSQAAHQATTQSSRGFRQLSAVKRELNQLRMDYRQLQLDLVRRNCVNERLLAQAHRQRFINCPCCAANLTLQLCEQTCCPGGLALINHAWWTNNRMATLLMGQAASSSAQEGITRRRRNSL